MFNAMRPSFSWSLTLVTCPPTLVFNAFKVTHLCFPPSWPIVVTCPLTNSLVFNMFKGVLSTSLSPSCLSHLIWTWLGLAPTCRSLTCASCLPCYVSSPGASCSPHWVLFRSLPMHMPLTCASCPPPYVSSLMHPAHLISIQCQNLSLGLLGFGCQLQLVCCAYLLTLSEYFGVGQTFGVG